MKTAAQWGQVYLNTSIKGVDFIEQIQADARAGMVPEAELANQKWKNDQLREANDQFAAKEAEHEAELAKAWESGWNAHGTAIGTGRAYLINDKLMIDLDWAQALQPPGGKST